MKIPFIFVAVCIALGLPIVSSGPGDLTLQVVTASIEAGNFTYYTLTYNGFISLVLESLEGDADLYISQHTLQPSFNPETYCLHSASCGIDQIDIPSSFQRPIGVAVYGHPFHPISTYRLSVILKEDPEAFNFWAEEDLENYNKETPAEETEKTLNKRNHVQDEEESVFWMTLWSFLEIMLEILIF